MRWTWMAVLALAAACDGIELEQLVKQHAPLTRIAPEPAGAHCAHGGSAVRTGLDLDDDGVLSDAEVRGTEYLCTTALPNVLMRAQSVPPGERCPHGGQVSRAGHDANGNGELEDEEVTREVYGCTQPETVLARLRPHLPPPLVCPGPATMAEAGPDGDRDGELDDGEARARVYICAERDEVRVRLLPEPAGPRCPAGGTRLLAGLDANGNGELDEEEPTSEAYVCQPLRTYEGHYVVKNAADVAALQGISLLRGHLSVMETALTEVVLPGLTAVEGHLRFHGNAALARVELPNLRFVEQSLVVESNASLETLVLGGAGREQLWVERNLELTSNPKLKSLSGLSFVSPRQSVYLRENDALEYTPGQEDGLDSVHALTNALFVSGNDALRVLPFPGLQQVGGRVHVVENAALTDLALGNLRSVGLDLYLSNNDALTSLSGLHQVRKVDGWLSVHGNDALVTTEGLVALVHAGAVDISSNAALEWAGELPSLRTIEFHLTVSNHPALRGVRNLGGLRQVPQVYLDDNALLTDVSGLAGLLHVQELHTRRNGALASLEALAGLQSLGWLNVLENGNLTRLGLDGLARVTQMFAVTHNPKLPGCLAQRLAATVYTGAPEQLRINDNDDTATCDD